jgi:hypothetical protein
VSARPPRLGALLLGLAFVVPAFAAAPRRESLPLPGRVVAAAELPAGGAALATLDDEGAVKLWRLDLAGGRPRLQPFPVSLPGELQRVAAAERGDLRLSLLAMSDGGLLVSRPGEVWLLSAGGARRLLDAPGFALAAAADGAAMPAPGAWPVAVARAGELRLLTPDSAEGERATLPVAARSRAWGLELTSPPVRQRPPAAAGVAAIVGPEKVGERRLRTLLVDTAGAVTESWSLLPAGERLLAGRPLVLDGSLLLAVTTAPSGVLAEQRLHLYRLSADRTRRGSAPTFSSQLQVRHWMTPELETGDLDGDGRTDLVLIEPRGMGGGEVTVSLLRGLGNGRVAPAAKRVKWDESWGDWRWADLTGDGRADLLRLSRGTLTLHAGERGERPVRGAAEWTVEVGGRPQQRTVTLTAGAGAEGGAAVESGTTSDPPPEPAGSRRGSAEGRRQRGDDEDGDGDDGYGPPRLATPDLDGDGRAEVVLWRRRDAGGSELLVLWAHHTPRSS